MEPRSFLVGLLVGMLLATGFFVLGYLHGTRDQHRVTVAQVRS